jgi:hypothetical protein
MALIANLISPKTANVFEYPAIPGFKVTLNYLTREELLKIREKATTQKINKRTRQMEDDVDGDLFQSLYVRAVVTNWEGLTIKGLAKLLPLDKSKIVDDSAEVPYDQEDAVQLMKNSPDFDSWVSTTIEDLDAFTEAK